MQRWKIYVLWPEIFFLGNPNVKIRVYEDTLKMFTTRHQRPIPDWGTHISRWIFIHKNHQRNVWTETGIHHSLQSAYLSHGAARILSSDLHNWTLDTQDEKNKFLLMCGWFWSGFFSKGNANHLLDSLKKHDIISTDWEGRNYLVLTIYWN